MVSRKKEGLAGRAVVAVVVATALAGCTQESQNQLGRSIQNWTGTNGVLDVLAGDKVLMRFIKIDKLSTALATAGERKKARPYRFGYGVHDRNQNYRVDPGEKKVYFEVSDYSTPYVFYENDGE
jgi:type IV pilus biogenesis protein CpaD/CtpE